LSHARQQVVLSPSHAEGNVNDYRPSTEAEQRVAELIARKKERGLSPEEQSAHWAHPDQRLVDDAVHA